MFTQGHAHFPGINNRKHLSIASIPTVTSHSTAPMSYYPNQYPAAYPGYSPYGQHQPSPYVYPTPPPPVVYQPPVRCLTVRSRASDLNLLILLIDRLIRSTFVMLISSALF
ncbi:hypothetical protein NECAME_05194, partial [Necator americanus]